MSDQGAVTAVQVTVEPPPDVPEWRENSPKGKRKKTPAGVWLTVKRLKDPHPEGHTHVCLRCGDTLKLNRANGSWQTTKALQHDRKKHAGESRPAALARQRESNRDSKRQCVLFLGASKARNNPNLSKREVALSEQAMLYVYCKQRLSKQTFDDERLKRALRAVFVAGGGQPKDTPMITSKGLRSWVRAEYENFKLFVKYVVAQGLRLSFGNPFARGMHDCVTLKNGKKCVAVGLAFVDPKLFNTHEVCLGLTEVNDNSSEALSAKLDEVCKVMTGHDRSQIVYSGNQDENSPMAAVLSDQEKMVTLLDPRRIANIPWEPHEKKEAKNLLAAAYVRFGLMAEEEKSRLANGRRLATAEARRSSSANEKYGGDWSFLSSDEEDDQDEFNARKSPEQMQEERKETLAAEFPRVFKKWVKRLLSVNWKGEFGVEPRDRQTLIDNWRSVPIGEFYTKLKDSDPRRRTYGYLPYMATHSRIGAGSLASASFRERIKLVGKLVVTKGNTKLDSDEIDMLATLRMNEKFMDFMRRQFNHVSMEEFRQNAAASPFS